LELPDFLVTQVQDGKVVLVLGAGASFGAIDSAGNGPPDGRALARLLADRFLGGAFHDAALSQVSEYAISESSLAEVQEFIRITFEPFEPAVFHTLVPKFRWFGLATTNYDRLIEKAYARDRSALQRVQPVIDNTDPLQDFLRDPDNVVLLKLHGCISRTANQECPLILTTDQYVQHRRGRSRLFDTLQEWGFERPLVFVGHSIQDIDLRALLMELGSIGERRQRFFVVAPDVSPVVQRFWETKRISALEGTFGDFLQALDARVPASTRPLARLRRTDAPHPIAERFRSRDFVMSPSLQLFLNNDVEFVRGAATEAMDARHFYRGMNSGWSPIEQALDVRRHLADTVLSDIVLADAGDHPSSGAEFVLIKGHAGAGKTVLLRRLAWDTAHDYNGLALLLKPQGELRSAAIRELLSATDERIYLFVDDAGDRARQLASLHRDLGRDGHRLTAFLAERINEWNVVGGAADEVIASEYVVQYLETDEISKLIALLERHRALGNLQQATALERVAAFEQRAGRQLLVALHEATLGRPFEDIIADEYENIVPAEAREMYLTVCLLNRLNVAVRAGLVARLHDIPFSFFEERFFKPLELVVQTSYDPLLRDHTYAARHPHIADIVFQRALSDVDLRLDKYLRCLAALNLEYSTDEKAFRQMVRGRIVADLFPDPAMARQVFRTARASVGDDAFLLQQQALYEMNSAQGDLAAAGELLDMAARRAPDDSSIKHSRAEHLIRLADVARTPLEREQRLREASRLASSLRLERGARTAGSYSFHTLAKVGLRRLEALVSDSDNVSTESLSSAIRSIEDILADGLQHYPGDSYLLSAEAELATLLKDSQRAINAMQVAFRANPGNGPIAVRLSKSLDARGDHDEAAQTLRTSLDANSADRRLHYALAKHLLAHAAQEVNAIEYHLQHSFSEGDRHYDAQLLYARQLYMKGDVNEARRRFKQLSEAAVPPAVRDKIQYPLIGEFHGGVVRPEATYCFIVRDGLADWVFAHRREVRAPWAEIRTGTRVVFQIGFTMKGAAATSVRLEAPEG
jgi:Flp pilus assembly protein TadD